MNVRKLFAFVYEAAVTGLAVAFLALLILRPEILFKSRAIDVIEAPPPAVSQGDGGAPTSYAPAVQTAAPAVVNIYTTKVVTQQRHPLFSDPSFRRFFGDRFGMPRQRLESSLGSGVIVSRKGYILTNNHVIRGADEIQVALADGRVGRARLVGADPDTDLAVLNIDLPDVPAITFGRSDSLRVGDVVLAIGNPFGVGQTVTQGIISATGRSELGISTFENFIQTDAAINPGNSGGALINTAGQLVGVNTAIFSRSGGSQGIGFAIPSSLALAVMEQIIEQGHVVRGWLGIEIQDLTPELAESFGLRTQQGAVVAGVMRGGAGAKAGLVPGDVLVSVAKQAVPNARGALNAIAALPPGKTVTLGIIRGGREMELRATVGERPSPR